MDEIPRRFCDPPSAAAVDPEDPCGNPNKRNAPARQNPTGRARLTIKLYFAREPIGSHGSSMIGSASYAASSSAVKYFLCTTT